MMVLLLSFIISLIIGIIGIILYRTERYASGMFLICFGWAAVITFGIILVI